MKHELISMFIDNELNLEEKAEFVVNIRDEAAFCREALDLLAQEKLLRVEEAYRLPLVGLEPKPSLLAGIMAAIPRPLIQFAAGLAVGLALLLAIPATGPELAVVDDVARELPHRFVIYLPQAERAELIGSFSHWQPVPLQRINGSGYWSLTLRLPEGEHQYSYLVGGTQQFADPTVTERVADDFGGENSILRIRVNS